MKSVDEGLTGSFKIKDIMQCIKHDRNHAKMHPYEFQYNGIYLFEGDQGTGKTLSAVYFVLRLMKAYPKLKLVTNVTLYDYPIVTPRDFWSIEENYTILQGLKGMSSLEIAKWKEDYYIENNRVFAFEGFEDFSKIRNGEFGVVFFIDEITGYISCKDSNDSTMDYIIQLSTQRKQKRLCVFTTQVFGEMEITMRRKFKAVIHCKNFWHIQCNIVIYRSELSDSQDKNSTSLEADKTHKVYWTHSPKLYNAYDTNEMVSYKALLANKNKNKRG